MRILTFSLFLFILACTACGDSSEKQSQELNIQALSHYQQNDLLSALEVYQKSLDIYENEEARSQMQIIKVEANAVTEALDIFKEVKKYQTHIRQAKYDKEILSAAKKIQEALVRLENVKSSDNTEISNFISSLDEDYFFFLEMQVDMTIISLQHGSGDVDITRLNELLDNFLEKTLFLDIYKV